MAECATLSRRERCSLAAIDKEISGQGFDSPDFKNLTWRADDTCTLLQDLEDQRYLHARRSRQVLVEEERSSWATLTIKDCVWVIDAITALGRNTWDWMFHKEEYMNLVSGGYMAADPKNRQEVFSDGDHISGNSLEPGGWSLENDNGAYKPGRDWTHKSFFMNPVYESAHLHQMMKKCHEDFPKAPRHDFLLGS